MSRRFTRLSMLLVLLSASEVWAIGLGDINLDSALNEPLRAEIVLLSASPDELADLTVTLASAETFARYGIDRPFFLQSMEFNIVSGAAGGSVVQIRSRSPITEPFLTFLVEATWSSGRLLREYTVLLDPPTYVAPSVQQAPAVEAPRRSTPSDSGRIERQPTPTAAPAQQPARSAPQPTQPARTGTAAGTQSPPQPRPVDNSPYATAGGGEIIVEKGQTLWGLAARNRPDSRLTMNQTMLAIYEANPGAFGGNINHLKAGSTIRVPSADEVFQISRGDALSEVQRQHSAWDGVADYSSSTSTTTPADTSTTDTSTNVPTLVLVPPDEEPTGTDFEDTTSTTYEPQNREDEIQDRINDLENADVPDQQSLIEIRDNELAALRQELADIRGEAYDPLDDEILADEMLDDEELQDAADDASIDDVMADVTDDSTDAEDAAADAEDAAADTAVPTNIVTSSTKSDEGILAKVMEFFKDWGLIVGAVVVVIGVLIWFMRRGDRDDDDNDRPWESLDSDEMAAGTIASTTTMAAPSSDDDAIVVVEQDSGVHPILEDTVEAPAGDVAAGGDGTSGAFGSLEDTFSSETAVNLDQTDPIAEADFHMAYGLYDQAADLINGALESDPSDKGLMSKLCEIYFVWGNRDAFVEAATRLKSAVGDGDSAEWDKIVIMGQQIAGDDHLFAGAALAGATKAVDLSFDESDSAGALDMDFGAQDSSSSEVIDLGSDESGVVDLSDGDDTQQGVDFNFDDTNTGDQSSVDFDLDVTAESPTIEESLTEATAEMPAPDADATAESPTIEDQFAGFGDGTSELPSLDEDSLKHAIETRQDADSTAEINLDDLGLDIDGLAETELASLDDLDDLDATGQNEALSDTGINEAIGDLSDVTGKNPEIDPNATGLVEGLDLSDLESSGMRLAADETGQNPMVDAEQESSDAADIGIDESLLDATGHTQILSEDMAVETAADLAGELSDADATMLAPGLGADAETVLAPLDDEDDDFDFAKTEALPPEAFGSGSDLETTAETPAIAGTDVDLDLDDLTAALQVSEIGDTIEQIRDDATVEQPRPNLDEDTAEVPTMNLAPEDMSDDLHEARTMTEVGTKLDLARAYVDMGDPAGARSILEEVLDEGDDGQKQQAQQLLDSLPS